MLKNVPIKVKTLLNSHSELCAYQEVFGGHDDVDSVSLLGNKYFNIGVARRDVVITVWAF
jgi:hypothetical protein